MENKSSFESELKFEEGHNDLPALTAGEVMLGRLESVDIEGNAVVGLPHLPSFKPRIALSAVVVSRQDIGRQVALMLTQGIDQKLIIMGLISSPLQNVLEHAIANTHSAALDEIVFPEPLIPKPSVIPESTAGTVYVDGKQVVLEGQEEVVLRCGAASITLSKNGKISIRGKYIVNRATDVNRILGGSVQVN